MSDAICEILEAEGIAVLRDAKCIAVRRDGDRIAVSVDCERPPREVAGSHLLLATGRRPNTDDLGCGARASRSMRAAISSSTTR